MGSFFKGIGKGLFNIVIIPVWAIGLVLSSIAGLGYFIFRFFIQAGKFITGRSMSLKLPEDEQAEAMLAPKVPTQESKNDDVEVVIAEIADPNVNFKEIDKPAHKNITTSNEEVDFVIDDSPLAIDYPNTMPEIRRNFNDSSINNTRQESNNPAPSYEPEKEPEEEKIEEYSPKGSDF